MAKKKAEITIHSSAAEYLTFVAATGNSELSFEMRYQDENIWLTQKMMATLYNVSVTTINEHIAKIYADGELIEAETIRKFRIVQTEGCREVNREVTLMYWEIGQFVGSALLGGTRAEYGKRIVATLSQQSAETLTVTTINAWLACSFHLLCN
ncbi:MAG: hypothetical protein FWD87_10565 [Spirochaetaceae bacterium]|nr:hypothetical protein [Spirochaetaceae bacterium]